MALFSLVKKTGKSGWAFVVAAIGASAMLADGIITPAVTVTSAVEGLRSLYVATPVVPIVLVIITVVFYIRVDRKRTGAGYKRGHCRDRAVGDQKRTGNQNQAHSYMSRRPLPVRLNLLSRAPSGRTRDNMSAAVEVCLHHAQHLVGVLEGGPGIAVVLSAQSVAYSLYHGRREHAFLLEHLGAPLQTRRRLMTRHRQRIQRLKPFGILLGMDVYVHIRTGGHLSLIHISEPTRPY